MKTTGLIRTIGLLLFLPVHWPGNAAPGEVRAAAPPPLTSPTINGAANAREPIRKITVVLDRNYPPLSFVDASGDARGYVVDLWRSFERHNPIAVELRLLDWTNAQRQVLSGDADVIDTLQRTAAREAEYDFGAPWLSVPVAVYVDRQISGITSPATLQGFPVAAEAGSACMQYLAAEGITGLRSYATNQEVIAAAAARDVHAFCMDEYPANFLLARYSIFNAYNQAFTIRNARMHYAVRKGNSALLEIVQRGMARIPPEELRNLQAQWLSTPARFTLSARIIGIALVVTAGLLALIGVWIWQLRRGVRRRTRELQKSRHDLRVLFDAIPDLVITKNRDGRITDANRSVIPFRGPRHNVIGKTAFDLLSDEAARKIDAIERAVMQSNEAQTILVNRLDGEGTFVNEEINVVPLHDDQGEVSGTMGIIRDLTERLRLENQLRLWAHAIQHADFGIALLEFDRLEITAVNDSFAFERGYSPDEMVGMPLAAFCPPDELEQERAQLQALIRSEHRITESEHLRRDGERFPVLLDRSLFRDAEDRPRYIVIYALDITERQRAQSELRLAAAAFETHDATIVLDGEGQTQRVNSAFVELTGYHEARVIGREPFFLDQGLHDRATVRDFWRDLRERKQWKGELWLSVREGRPKVVRAHISAVTDSQGRIAHFVCALIDLTREREAHARADRLGFFDALTDLPNRNHLFGQLDHLTSGPDSPGGVLLVIDLDHFKRVNELHGHATGDRLLNQIAQRLRGYQEDGETVARLNGGVFAWLSARLDATAQGCASRAADCAGRIRRALAQPFALGDIEPITITASIGWSCFMQGDETAAAILQEAELAMYAAKEDGRDQVRRFEPAMQETRVRRQLLINALRAAIADPGAGGLCLYAQPQHDGNGSIPAVELLLRWRLSDGQLYPPEQFVRIAEENGLIEALGRWVFRQACAHLTHWSRHPATRQVSMAVNVSPHQFARPGFTGFIRETLLEHDVDPSRVTLELTESALLGDLDEVAARLGELRSIGVRISLDDFGTGYSSLSYLSRLPIDELKIDRTFVSRLPDGKVDAMLAATVIAMAHGLGLQVVAEGVETEAQRDWLQQHGCDLLQGYLLARPMPVKHCEARLTALSVP